MPTNMTYQATSPDGGMAANSVSNPTDNQQTPTKPNRDMQIATTSNSITEPCTSTTRSVSPTSIGSNISPTEQREIFQRIDDLFDYINNPVDELDLALSMVAGDDFDRLIEDTIEAFDKQNFVTRGFLAKLPELQHRFLVGS